MTVVEDAMSPAHACAIPVSDEQLWEMTARYLADGLAAGEHVIYFEDGTLDPVLERLADDEVDVNHPLRNGQLAVVPGEMTRGLLRGSASDVLTAMDDAIGDALAQGFPAVRLTGQAHSGLDRCGLDTMLDYESRIDQLLAGRPARVMCFYDRTRFPEDAVTALRGLHRHEIVAPAVYDDSLLRITTPRPGLIRLAGEVDHSNRPRIKRALESALDQALRSHSSEAEITLDLSSLRFLDVAGAVSLVHAAEEFPSTHRLVLTRVRPSVLRLLDRCGAPFAHQLRVEPRETEPAAGPDRTPAERAAS